MASTRATAALRRLSASTPRTAAQAQAQRSFGAWAKATAMGKRAMPAVATGGAGMRHSRAAVGSAMGAFEARRWNRQDASKADVEPPARTYEYEDIKQIVQAALPRAEQQDHLEDDDSKPLLVDVRTPTEYAAGAIPSAVNLPVTSAPDAFFAPPDEFEDRYGFPKPHPRREVVLYCKAGVRSHAAAQLARQAGYTNVVEYPGSWLDWEKRKQQDGSE